MTLPKYPLARLSRGHEKADKDVQRLVARAQAALANAGAPRKEIDLFLAGARGLGYNDAMLLVKRWVRVL